MIEWKISQEPVGLQSAVEAMEQRVLDIYEKKKSEMIWMLEHPHVYTGGTSSKENHLLDPAEIPVIPTGRGGSYTYHGPGQRVIYVMLDLRRYGKDLRKFVWSLEQWIIDTLLDVGLNSERRANRVGIWVSQFNIDGNNLPQASELKIASIGLRVKKWISYFGISINVFPDMHYFDGIVACGNEGYGVTSLKQQGIIVSLTELDNALFLQFRKRFTKCC